MAAYRRVMLKLSGEALKSDNDLFDFDKIRETAEIIREMHSLNVEIGVVIGAGNIWRGRQGPSANMDAVVADQMGMLGTVINCLCLSDALRKAGMDAVVMSSARVMPICMAMGEGAGVGAALAVRYGISPKDVDVQEIREILRKANVLLEVE